MSSSCVRSDQEKIQVPLSYLPSGKKVYFRESSFFTRHSIAKLPSPAQIRSLPTYSYAGYPPVIRFPEIGVLVKYGRLINVSEGQCLWMIRHFLKESVPVPELYGWIVDGDETFIYMELLDGDTLEERWSSLSHTDRVYLCEELREMVTSLRRLEQLPNERFIGPVGRQPLDDVTFSGIREGPWPSVKEFNDWFSGIMSRRFNVTYDDPFRAGLSDNVPIYFTHGDLHPRNILVTQKAPPRILALVDFHQSAWMPAYWEYCKALLTAAVREEWEIVYIPMFLEPYPECFKSYEFYANSLGC
ncbi:hypothetical protein Plec18167_004002 [Paecilomyces lecythidis]|uniref:Aminoglycoside phosphotransferase domain-containing protein n=1 Tax=Paecilomyces lecythidis TaxID=3004212 RepID=A0ABR3XV41_9EURO